MDSVGPTVLGYYYGYPKHLGKFKYTTNSERAWNLEGQPVSSIVFNPIQAADADEAPKNYEFFKQVLINPVIANGYGPLLCSRAQFNFEQAEAHPLSATVELYSALRPSLAGKYEMPGLDSPIEGALSFKASALLFGPIDCNL